MALTLEELVTSTSDDDFVIMDNYRSSPDLQDLSSFDEDLSVDTLELDLLKANLRQSGIDAFQLCARMGINPRREEVCVLAHHAILVASQWHEASGEATVDDAPIPPTKNSD